MHTITGVDTSIALFMGWTAQGPTDRAVRLTSFADFESEFGSLDSRALLPYSVKQFYDNGGTDAYVLRIARDGDDGTVLKVDDSDFSAALMTSIGPGGASEQIDLFNLLCVPGLTEHATIASLQSFCKARRAFLIVDCPETETAATVLAKVSALTAGDAMNSAFYFPWVRWPDPSQAGAKRNFPPCGFVAGIYARTDSAQGVWKAPAGRAASLIGAVGLSTRLSSAQNDQLNPLGINCLRTFPGHGTVVWGSRTLHGADGMGSEWKYVPVRRMALFLEESIYLGTQWVTSEANDEQLWGEIRLSIGAFMQSLFLKGAFRGTTPSRAYFVKCDSDTTTQADVAQGRLNVVVGFAPLKPAEFVIITLQQMVPSEG